MGKGDATLRAELPRVALRAAALILLGLVALFACAPIFAVDFFWQLSLGKQIVEQASIPTTDGFSSVHPEAHYVQFQWLWEVLAYAAFRVGGLGGVRVFQVLVLVGSFVVLARASMRLLSDRALALAFCALALVLFEDRFQARPSALALGFSAALLPLWLDPALRDRPRTWAYVGGVACLWSNLHSGESLLAPLAFMAIAGGSLLGYRLGTESRARAQRDLRLFAASGVGVLACPTLYAGLASFARAIGPQLATGNKEWRPSYTMLENGFTPSFLSIALGPSLVTVAYVLANWRRRPPAWPEWALAALMLLLAHQAVRNAFLCLIPLCALWMRAKVRRPRLSYALACALMWVAFEDHVIEGYGGVVEAAQIISYDLAPDTFPEQLATMMREANIEGGAINDGRWGGYLIWELWPRVHVFADTRQNFSAAMWPVFLASQRSDTRAAALREAFQRWRLELAIFRGPAFALVAPPPEWQLLYKAGDQELYQHRAGAHAAKNVRRATRWREAQGGDPATVGARRWLAAHQRELAAARALKASPAPHDQLRGFSIESRLLFEAGLYPEALRAVRAGLAIDPLDGQLLYRAAVCSYVVGDRKASASALRRLPGDALSAAQRARVAALARALR